MVVVVAHSSEGMQDDGGDDRTQRLMLRWQDRLIEPPALLSEEGQVAMLVLCAFGSDGASVHDDSVAGCSRA